MKLTALFVFLGIFFDFFDGLLARKLKVQSELGLQLDSLADMITSGLVPGLVMFYLLSQSHYNFDIVQETKQWTVSTKTTNVLPYISLLITLASAYRLAKFNIDDQQNNSFIGLPTPANALLILSLPLIIEFQGSGIVNTMLTNKWVLIGITILSAFLLNANVSLLALKFKNWTFKDNKKRYSLMFLSLLLLIIFKFIAIPLIILLYIFISLLK